MTEVTIAQPQGDNNRYYVYVIFRWNGIPCYIGKGQGDRWNVHSVRSCNNHLKSIVAQSHSTLPVLKLREELTESEAFETEIALIAAIGRGKRGPLVNQTDGGEGSSGYKHAAASIEKFSASLRGRKQSPEAIAKRAAARVGVPLKPNHRAAIAKGNRGHRRPTPPAISLVIAATMKAKGLKWWLRSDGSEYRSALPLMPDDMRGRRKQSKSTIAKRALSQTGTPLSAAHKLAIGQGNKGRPSPKSQPFRARVSVTMLAKGLRWWCSQDGNAYRSRSPKNVGDILGRRLK